MTYILPIHGIKLHFRFLQYIPKTQNPTSHWEIGSISGHMPSVMVGRLFLGLLFYINVYPQKERRAPDAQANTDDPSAFWDINVPLWESGPVKAVGVLASILELETRPIWGRIFRWPEKGNEKAFQKSRCPVFPVPPDPAFRRVNNGWQWSPAGGHP